MTRAAAFVASVLLEAVAPSSDGKAAGAQPAGSAPNVLLIQADDLETARTESERWPGKS